MAIDVDAIIKRPAVRLLAHDCLGQLVYRVMPPPVIVRPDGVRRALSGARLDGWYSDRCAVDLFGVQSQTGGVLNLALVSARMCSASTLVDFTVRLGPKGLTLVAGVPRDVFWGEVSAPITDFWFLIGEMSNPAEDCTFTPAFMIDHAGAGSYTLSGDAT